MTNWNRILFPRVIDVTTGKCPKAVVLSINEGQGAIALENMDANEAIGIVVRYCHPDLSVSWLAAPPQDAPLPQSFLELSTHPI